MTFSVSLLKRAVSVGVRGMELWFLSPVWLAVDGSDSHRAGGGFEWVGSYDGKAIFFFHFLKWLSLNLIEPN